MTKKIANYSIIFWEVNNSPNRQTILCSLWNHKVHSRDHKSRHLSLSLVKFNRVHTLLFVSFQINFNVIFPSTPWSSKWSFPSDFDTTKSSRHFSCVPHMTYGLIFLSFLIYHANKILSEIQIMKLLDIQYFFLHCPHSSSLLIPDLSVSLSTLFSNTLSLRSFLTVWDQVSYPYKSTDTIIILCILIFIFIERKQEEK